MVLSKKWLIGLSLPLILLSQPEIDLDYSLPYYDIASIGVFNPASLASIYRGGFGIRVGIGTRGRGSFDLLRLQSNPLLGDLSLPLEVEFSRSGGVEYIGGVARMGRWVIGGGFRKAEFLRLRPQIDTIISKRYRFELPYYPVTRRDIPQLPSDTLVIFTDLEVEGDGIVHMHSEGKGEISTLPLFLSLATESYGLRMGIGLDITAFSGDINLWERDSGGFYNAIVKAKASYSIPMGWEMNVNVRGSMSEDTLWIGRLKGTLSGFQLSLRMGGQTEFHKLGLGVMIEQQFPATIGTLYGNTIYVSGLPEDIYSYSDSLKVDTNNQRVTGDWRMDFIDLPKEMENTTYPIKIPMDTKLCLDVNYPVKNLNLGGWVLASLYEFGLGLGIGSKESLIPWGVRLGAHSKRYKIENFSPPPIWEFYLGNSLEFRGVMVDFGFKIDTAIIALLSLVENSRVSSVGGFWFGINYLF